MDAIRTVGLRKAYGDVMAVDGLDLDVKRGELMALLGVNGAGKTTVIRMLSCLGKPSGGNAWINGMSIIDDSRRIKGIVGISPQETAVAPLLSVRENLVFMARIHGFDRKETDSRIGKLSDAFGLDGVMDRKAGKLSGGWQRRLSIAMALIGEPEILFLDEPTLGLDVIARSELWSLVRSLKGRMTIMLTTHYLEEAEALADRIAIMRSGKLLKVGTAAGIKACTGCDRFEDAFISIVTEGKR